MTLSDLMTLMAFYLAAGLLLDRLIKMTVQARQKASRSKRVLQTVEKPAREHWLLSAISTALGAGLTGLLSHPGGLRLEAAALMVVTAALLVEELGQRCPADMLPDTLQLLTACLSYRVGTGTLFEALDKAELSVQNPALKPKLREVLSLHSYTTVSLADSLQPLALEENRYLKRLAEAIVDANGTAGPALDARIKPLIEAAERDWRSPALRWLLRTQHQQVGRMAAAGALGMATLNCAPLALEITGGPTLLFAAGLGAAAAVLYLMMAQPWLRRSVAVAAVALLAIMVTTRPVEVLAETATPTPVITATRPQPSATVPLQPTPTLPEGPTATATTTPTLPPRRTLPPTPTPTRAAADRPERTPAAPTRLPATATAPVLPTATAPDPQPTFTAPPMATATAPSLSDCSIKE